MDTKEREFFSKVIVICDLMRIDISMLQKFSSKYPVIDIYMRQLGLARKPILRSGLEFGSLENQLIFRDVVLSHLVNGDIEVGEPTLKWTGPHSFEFECRDKGLITISSDEDLEHDRQLAENLFEESRYEVEVKELQSQRSLEVLSAMRLIRKRRRSKYRKCLHCDLILEPGWGRTCDSCAYEHYGIIH